MAIFFCFAYIPDIRDCVFVSVRSAGRVPYQSPEQLLRHCQFCEQHSSLERYEEIYDDLSQNVSTLVWLPCDIFTEGAHPGSAYGEDASRGCIYLGCITGRGEDACSRWMILIIIRFLLECILILRKCIAFLMKKHWNKNTLKVSETEESLHFFQTISKGYGFAWIFGTCYTGEENRIIRKFVMLVSGMGKTYWIWRQ